MVYIVLALISYVIGSIPNGLIIGKTFCNIDIRQFGSKNIGATNAFRVLGVKPAAAVLVTDAVKGIVGVYLGVYLVGTPVAELVGGIFAIIGHNWSIFLKFRGGRGVATGLGVIAILVPKVTAGVFVVWLAIVFITRYVSLASIVAALFVPIGMWLVQAQGEFLWFGLIAAAFVVFRHKPNIERLLKGEELKIKAGSTKDLPKKE
jgi:glycerol-3-phosphate acyltransferase PlsY